MAKRLNLAPPEAAKLTSLVTVEVNRNKPNVIAIRANYNNPHLAAEIANSVADVVLAAYIEMQNSTLRGMLDERQQRRIRLQARLAELEAAKVLLTSPDSFLNPEDELNRLSNEIVETMGQIEAGRAEVIQLQAAIAEAERLMTTIPEEIQHSRRIRTTDTSAVDSMQATLDAMRLKYTEAHPRVISLANELASVRKKMAETASDEIRPDEVVYVVNYVRIVLEESRNKAEVQMAGQIKINEVRTKRVAELQKLVPEHLKILGAYPENQRNIETVARTISQLDSTINDMELLLNRRFRTCQCWNTLRRRCPTSNPSKLVMTSVTAARSR